MANLKVTQIHSIIGRPEYQRKVLKGLGLTRMHQSVVLPDNGSVRGMVFKIKHLVETIETDEPVSLSRHPKRPAVKANT